MPVRLLALACLSFALSASVAQDKKKDDPKPDFKTTAEAIVKEFLKDEKAAQKKYKDKFVELEGTVFAANKVLSDKGVWLDGAKKDPKDVVATNVLCYAPAARLEKAFWLGKGQKVKVVGKFAGGSGLAVSLLDCTFTELKPSPTLKTTAKAVAADFDKDEEAATTKYLIDGINSKEIIVEGVVSALEKTKNDFFIVKLEGSGGLTVNCVVDEAEWKKLKKGDKVTMKGDLSGFYKDEKKVNVNTAFVLKKG
jgi:tRNA_anti-like